LFESFAHSTKYHGQSVFSDTSPRIIHYKFTVFFTYHYLKISLAYACK